MIPDNTDMIGCLLAKGADVNARDKDGNTPIYWAANYHHDTNVELLLRSGAEVDWEGEHCPLAKAKSKGKAAIKVVELLEDYRRNPSKYTSSSQTFTDLTSDPDGHTLVVPSQAKKQEGECN